MSEIRQSNQDLLAEAVRAFQCMPVGERPADEEVLARLGAGQGGGSRLSRISIPSKRLLQLAAAAVLCFGGLAIVLRSVSPPESVRMTTSRSPESPGGSAARSPSESEAPEGLRVPSLKETAAEAQVIVVATGLDSAPAPPEVPGDLPEVFVRWQVQRVLKGDLGESEIRTRMSTAAAEFIGRDWIVFLTPDYMAGTHRLASCLHIEFERTVERLVADGE